MDAIIRHLAAGDSIPFKDYNSMADICEAMARSGGPDCFFDSTGLHFRRKSGPPAAGMVKVLSGPSERSTSDKMWATYSVQSFVPYTGTTCGDAFNCRIKDVGVGIAADVAVGPIELGPDGVFYCVPTFRMWSARFELNLWSNYETLEVGTSKLMIFGFSNYDTLGTGPNDMNGWLPVPCDCTLYSVAAHIPIYNPLYEIDITPVGKSGDGVPCPDSAETSPCYKFYASTGVGTPAGETVVGFRVTCTVAPTTSYDGHHIANYSPSPWRFPTLAVIATFLEELK